MKIGILGATGWLGQALGLRLLGRGVTAGDIVLLNRSGRLGGYAGQEVIWARDAAELAARADVLVLSVRPGDFPPEGFDPGGKLVISFMTGWTLARLEALFPKARLVRAMPNSGAPLGQSFTPWTGGVSQGDAALAEGLLSALGPCARVADEAALDYLTALSGSGAAYPALMARALLQDARARGLPEPIAQAAVEAVICGSAEVLRGRMGSLDALIEDYLGYRGVTAAGIAVAEAPLTGALRAALAAASEKATEMGCLSAPAP